MPPAESRLPSAEPLPGLSSSSGFKATAYFDVDGTLIRGDSFVLYLVFVLLRRPSRWLRSPLLALGVARFALDAVIFRGQA